MEVKVAAVVKSTFWPKYSEATVRGNIVPARCFTDIFLHLLLRIRMVLRCYDGHYSVTTLPKMISDARYVLGITHCFVVAHLGSYDPHMQELKICSSFMHIPHRHASDRVPVLLERLLDPLKNLSLPAILLRVTEKHAAFG